MHSTIHKFAHWCRGSPCILRNRDVSQDVARLRAEHPEMGYCFSGQEFDNALSELAGQIGL